MIIVMQAHAKKELVEQVIVKVKQQELKPVPLYGTERTVIAVIGDSRRFHPDTWRALRGVEKVMKVLKPYKLASREPHNETTVIDIDGVKIGNGHFAMIAGPCSVENEEQIMQSAKILKAMGVKIMRASAFKPRTSPYSFQGLGVEGLKLLKKVREKTGMLVESEVMDVRDVKIAEEHLDVLRVGARNMQNYDLLKELGKTRKPIILKRGMSATINELLMCAEYILSKGNAEVILCERGIRTFETSTRNALDISSVPVLKELTHLPVIVDPSHAAGRRSLVPALSRAAIAAGADGLLIEMHPHPEKALSDGAQSLTPEQLSKLIQEVRQIGQIVGKKVN